MEPRPYQLELLGEAQRRNIIAFLDTGSGKTLISILLMESMATPLVPIDRDEVTRQLHDRLLQESSDSSVPALKDEPDRLNTTIVSGIPLPKQPKKIVFCVPTIALVTQQAEKIRQSTDLAVGEYSRDEHASVTHWDALGWTVEMSQRHVLVFTPQIFLNCLRHGFISLVRDVSLLIFDECHHAWKNHPYKRIMYEFYHSIPAADFEKRPKVLGMTASPIYQKSLTQQMAVEQLVELQRCLDCTIVTVKERDALDGFVSKAREYLVEYFPTAGDKVFDLATKVEVPHGVLWDQMPVTQLSPSGKLLAYYVWAMNYLKLADSSCGDVVGRCLTLVKDLEVDLGLWCAARVAQRLYHSIFSFKKRGNPGENNEESVVISGKRFQSLSLPDPPPTPTLDSLAQSDLTHKVRTLLEIISSRVKTSTSENSSIKQFRGMVFVEKRTTASILCDLLTQLSATHFSGLSCGFVTGQGSSSHAPDKMKSSVQQRVLDRFRSGEVQLMVVTRVAEEGIDIPACKLIVIFDIFRSNTGYVQSRGRARHLHGSEYILLVKRNDTHTLDTIANAKVAEMMARSIVSTSILASTEEKASSNTSAEITRGDTDNSVIEQLVGSDDIYSTPLTTVAPSGFEHILARFLKRKVVYEVELEGSREKNPAAWDAYSKAKTRQDSELHKDSFAGAVSSSFSGFAYSVQIFDDTSHPFSKIVGSVRFTRKSAIQSAALEAIRYLHTAGALNDHLLPVVKSKQKGLSGFSFSKEILRLKQKMKQSKTKQKTGGPQVIYDVASGEKTEDAAHEYARKIPKCLLNSEKWESLLTQSEGNESKSKPAFVQLYATLITMGPQIETFTRGCDPPVVYASHFVQQNRQLEQNTNHYYSNFINGALVTPPVEPRRSFAILTLEPIPVDDIPSFPVFLESKPCKVELESWDDGQTRKGDQCLKMSLSNFDQLKSFQSKLWEFALPIHKMPEHQIPVAGIARAYSAYLIAPMIGHAIVNPNQVVDSTWLSPCEFNWSLDWDLIENVLKEKRMSLHDWVIATEHRLSNESIGDGISQKKQRLDVQGRFSKIDSLSSSSGSSICILKTEPRNVGPWNFQDPVYEISESDDSDIDVDGDVIKPKAEFLELMQSLGLSSQGNSSKSMKRKRSIVAIPEVQNAWGCVDLTSKSGSFDQIFDMIHSLSVKNKIPSVEVMLPEDVSIVQKLNALLGQILVQTPHNKTFYTIDQLAVEMNANSAFETEKFSDVSCFGDYFEKLGYVLSHREDPLVQVSTIPLLRNFSRPFHVSEDNHPSDAVAKYLVLDVCQVVPLPLELLRLAQTIPSIMYRLESFCLMLETRVELGLEELTLSNLQQAFTSSSALESYSYERLEILGDALLKYASSADLLDRFPDSDEGQLSAMRSAVVSNQNLFKIAKQFDFGGLLVVSPFKPRYWSPPHPFVNADLITVDVHLKYSKKRLADFVEALIGCAFIDGGLKSAFKLLIKFGLVHERALSSLEISSNVFRIELDDQSQLPSVFSTETPALEFLGDAVLDWIVMQLLYQTYTTLSPEELSDLRQAAVNNESFCRISVCLGLHEHLLHSSPPVSTQVHSYLQHISAPGAIDMDPLDATQEGPKVLGDLLEAAVGAIYLDSHNSIATVWQVLKPLLSGFFLRFVNPAVVSKSPIRQMHEHFQSVGFQPEEVWYWFSEPNEKTSQQYCCKIFLLDCEIAEDFGSSRQLSKRRASVAALKWIADHGDLIAKLMLVSEQQPGKTWAKKLATSPIASSVIAKSEPFPRVETLIDSEAVLSERETDPVASFQSCLVALEMAELRHLDQSQRSGFPTVNSGDYFLLQLLAIQQQERQQLQMLQERQLKLLYSYQE